MNQSEKSFKSWGQHTSIIIRTHHGTTTTLENRNIPVLLCEMFVTPIDYQQNMFLLGCRCRRVYIYTHPILKAQLGNVGNSFNFVDFKNSFSFQEHEIVLLTSNYSSFNDVWKKGFLLDAMQAKTYSEPAQASLFATLLIKDTVQCSSPNHYWLHKCFVILFCHVVRSSLLF